MVYCPAGRGVSVAVLISVGVLEGMGVEIGEGEEEGVWVYVGANSVGVMEAG